MMLTGLNEKFYEKIQVRQTDYSYLHCYYFLFSGRQDARFTSEKMHNFLAVYARISYRTVEEAWARGK